MRLRILIRKLRSLWLRGGSLLFDDEYPATYYIRVPGGTVGSICLDDDYNIKSIFIDPNYVVESYPANINEQVRKFVGERMVE